MRLLGALTAWLAYAATTQDAVGVAMALWLTHQLVRDRHAAEQATEGQV